MTCCAPLRPWRPSSDASNPRRLHRWSRSPAAAVGSAPRDCLGDGIEVLQGVATDAGLPTLTFCGLADNCAIAQLGGASLAGWDGRSRTCCRWLNKLVNHWCIWRLGDRACARCSDRPPVRVVDRPDESRTASPSWGTVFHGRPLDDVPAGGESAGPISRSGSEASWPPAMAHPAR